MLNVENTFFIIICKLFGVWPHSVRSPPELSPNITYFLHAFAIISFQLYCHVQTYFDESYENATDEYYLSNLVREGAEFLWHSYSITSFLYIIIMFCQRKKLAKFLANLNQINKNLQEQGLPTISLTKYTIQIYILAFCVICRGISMYFSTKLLYRGMGLECDWRVNCIVVCNDLYIVLVIWQFIGMILLIRDLVEIVNKRIMELCNEVGSFFQVSSVRIEVSCDNSVIKYAKNSGQTGSFVKRSISYGLNDEEDMTETVKQLAIFHERITNAARNLSECYGYQVLLSIAGIFVAILFGVYYVFKFITEYDSNPDPSLSGRILLFNFYYNIFPIIGLVVVVVSCSEVADQAQQTAVNAHRLINQSNNPALISRLHSLSLQVLHHSAKFSACGFPLDRTLFYSFFATAVTYLVILIEFEQKGGQTTQTTSTVEPKVEQFATTQKNYLVT